MIFLVLSIAASVTVGVLLKLAKRYQISIMQAVTWNYLFAILLCMLFLQPSLTQISGNFVKPIYLLLGILLPVIFLIQGFAIQKAGLAKTDIAQRLSLFISLCAAYFLFKENFDTYKIIGLILGFLAILCTMYRKQTGQSSRLSSIYLLLVFIGFGLIDVLFKLVSQITEVTYPTSLLMIFCIAFGLSLCYILYRSFVKKDKLKLVNFLCGCVLGFFNFGNILFYMKAHREMSSQPFIVFATMNLGVIIFGSLIGIFLFKEKFTRLNYFGLAIALLAIILITLSKIYAVQ